VTTLGVQTGSIPDKTDQERVPSGPPSDGPRVVKVRLTTPLVLVHTA